MSRRDAIANALRVLAPKIPGHELESVLDHALTSPGLKSATPEAAAWLSVVAYARHVFTDYDELLRSDYDQESARFFVREDLADVLQAWGVRRPVSEAD